MLVAANAQIGAAKALYFPRISMTGLLGMESDDLKNFVKASARTWSIGAQALQPIFNAGRIRSINEPAGKPPAALAQYEQVIQTAFREVSDALVGYRKTREQRVQQELLVGALRAALCSPISVFLGALIAICRCSMRNATCSTPNWPSPVSNVTNCSISSGCIEPSAVGGNPW